MAASNAPKSGSSVDALSDDISRTNARVLDLQTQVQRLLRINRIEEREDAVGQRQSETALLRTVAGLTRSVQFLAQAQTPQSDLDADFYQKSKAIRTRQVRQNVTHKMWLSTLAQETTYLCPCGKHLGIKLLDHGKVIEENLCPVHWWVTLSQLAYEQGRLKVFRKELPLDKFVSKFSLKSSMKNRT